MKKISLKELATITAGQSAPKPELFSNEGLPFVRAGCLEELIAGKKESDFELISNDVAKELRMNLYPEGSILFAKSGMSATKNRFYQLKTPAYVVSHLAVLIPKDHFFSDYLRHVLIKYPPSSLIKDLAYPAISLGDIENFKVPVPEDFDDQIRIATLLSKVENLISRRREQLKQLDELLKSVFLDMFGDPVRNEKGWEIKRMDEISDSRLGKMRDKKFITGNHLRKYIGNSNVQWFRFKLDDLEEMDFDERERALFALKDGDLLICEGGDIGRCAIWRNNLTECYFQKAIHRLRLKKSQAIPEYVQYVMMFFSLYNGFKNVTCKATISHLTGEKLKETLIPLPPLELQNQFANIEEKIKRIKSHYQKSLTVQENLYEVLSQKAFKGELDLSRVQLVEEGDLVI